MMDGFTFHGVFTMANNRLDIICKNVEEARKKSPQENYMIEAAKRLAFAFRYSDTIDPKRTLGKQQILEIIEDIIKRYGVPRDTWPWSMFHTSDRRPEIERAKAMLNMGPS